VSLDVYLSISQMISVGRVYCVRFISVLFTQRRAEITVCVDRTVRDDDRRLALNMDLLQTCSPVQEICYLQFGPCYMRTCVLSDRSRSLASWHNDESYLRSTQRQGSAEASDA
jgi:hypothetical protein